MRSITRAISLVLIGGLLFAAHAAQPIGRGKTPIRQVTGLAKIERAIGTYTSNAEPVPAGATELWIVFDRSSFMNPLSRVSARLEAMIGGQWVTVGSTGQIAGGSRAHPRGGAQEASTISAPIPPGATEMRTVITATGASGMFGVTLRYY